MSAKIREALMCAAITCGHHITAGEVRLEHEAGEPGPTALGQMANRLERAFDVCAAPMVDRITALEAEAVTLRAELAKKDQEIAEIRAVSIERRDAIDGHHMTREWERQLSGELATAKAENAELLAALQEIIECPFTIDDATVAACGLEETMRLSPYQVVAEMSVSLSRIRNARAAISKATGSAS